MFLQLSNPVHDLNRQVCENKSMSRAAVTCKTKDELETLNLAEIDQYISWLEFRLSVLGTRPGKSIQKYLRVAEKVRSGIGPSP
jgi:hypothetical protein